MENPENNLDQGRLTVPGFESGSCCLTNQHDNIRMPVEPTAKGQRFMTQSAYGFLPWNFAILKTALHAGLNGKIYSFAGNPAMMNLHPEMMLQETRDFLVTDGVQKQTALRFNDPEKIQIIALNADLSSHMPCRGMDGITHNKTITTSSKSVNTHSERIATIHLNFQIVSKTPFRGLKTRRIKLLFDTISGQKYSGKTVSEKCDLLIND